MIKIEKATELLRDAICGEYITEFGGIAGESPENLTVLETETAFLEIEIDARCIDERAGIYVGENGREEIRMYGDFSYTAVANSFDECDEIKDYSMSIKFEEIVGVKSGVRVSLGMRLQDCTYKIVCSPKMQNLLKSPRFGHATIADLKMLVMTYDMILGDVESFEIYGVRIFNTLVETFIHMHHSANEIIQNIYEDETLELEE